MFYTNHFFIIENITFNFAYNNKYPKSNKFFSIMYVTTVGWVVLWNYRHLSAFGT